METQMSANAYIRKRLQRRRSKCLHSATKTQNFSGSASVLSRSQSKCSASALRPRMAARTRIARCTSSGTLRMVIDGCRRRQIDPSCRFSVTQPGVLVIFAACGLAASMGGSAQSRHLGQIRAGTNTWTRRAGAMLRVMVHRVVPVDSPQTIHYCIEIGPTVFAGMNPRIGATAFVA